MFCCIIHIYIYIYIEGINFHLMYFKNCLLCVLILLISGAYDFLPYINIDIFVISVNLCLFITPSLLFLVSSLFLFEVLCNISINFV